ncbi:MAG TPA: phospholipase D-like domain-containing protein, partial [Candidatus Xenobia bacterium]
AYYPKLLAAGVKIYLYGGAPMAHTKAAVFDGHLVTMGTSNLDGRSLLANYEDNVWIDDVNTAQDLTQRYFNKDLATSQSVTEYHPTGWQAVKSKAYALAGKEL